MAILFCRKCKTDLDEDLFARDRKRASGKRYICRKCSAEEYQMWSMGSGYIRRSEKQKENEKKLKLENPRLLWAKRAKYRVNDRSKNESIKTDITLEWLLSVMPDRCPLLDIELNYANDASHFNSPAIDRKDNSKGYSVDNCWIVSMKANRIKTNGTQKEIEMVAENLKRFGVK